MPREKLIFPKPTPISWLIRAEKKNDAWELTIGGVDLPKEPQVFASAEEVLGQVRSFLNMTCEHGDTLHLEVVGRGQLQGDFDTAGVCVWLGSRMDLRMDPATGNIRGRLK